MHINVKDGWHGSKYAIARMMKQQASAGRPRGRIINIASIGGLVGIAQEPAYCASKGAVVNLTRQLAVGFVSHEINGNAIFQGFLQSAMVKSFLEQDGLKLGLEPFTPWPRLGTGQDIAKAAVFLASDDAEWMSGHNPTVDGAFTFR